VDVTAVWMELPPNFIVATLQADSAGAVAA
jgi:hypothetical protein